MKKRISAILLITMLSVLMCSPVFAKETEAPDTTAETTEETAAETDETVADNAINSDEKTLDFQDVTFSMKMPEDMKYDGLIYVIYKGTESDLFLELTPENNFEQVQSVPKGTYTLYQVINTTSSDYSFLATDHFELGDDPVFCDVYIRGESGYINESLIEGTMPEVLKEYSDEVAMQLENEQKAQYEELAKQQEEQANMNAELDSQAQAQDVAENAAPTISPLTIVLGVIALILVIGMIIGICIFVTIRKEKKRK